MKSLAEAIAAAALLLCSVSGAVASATGAVEVLRQGIAHDALFDICGDGKRMLVAGASGELLERTEGESAWKPVASGLTQVAFLGLNCTGSRRIAVGQGGLIAIEDDGGWQAVDSGSEQRLLAVDANSAGLAVAVGGFGTVLVSRDAGRSWETQTFDWFTIAEEYAEPHLYGVFVGEDGVVTMVGEFGLIMRSADGGQTWQRVHKGAASLFGLHVGSDGTAYAVGQEGTALKSTDGGLNWSPLELPTNVILLGVWADQAGQVFISGMRSMLHSTDAGQSWSAVEGADLAVGWYSAITPDPGGTMLAVGNQGRVLALPGTVGLNQ